MLMAIRDRVTGIFAWIIIGLIIIPFALWGIQEYIGVNTNTPAIKFNDTDISMPRFEQSLSFNRQRLAQQFNGQLPPILENPEFLKKQTVKQLIDREALVQYADVNHFGASANAIYDNLQALSQFQKDGKFSTERYKTQVRSAGYTQAGFEKQLVSDIVIAQLQQGLVDSALVSDKQLADYTRLRNQVRDIEYFTLPVETYRQKVTVSDEELQTYYDAHTAELLTEEQVALEYIELNIEELSQIVEVDAAQLRQLYDDGQIAVPETPESREARHILIAVDASADETVIADKQKQIAAIQQRISKGEDFAALAKELSDDAGSASSGGSLGTVNRGVMVKPFEDALFALAEAGDLSEPVKTQFGFHLIKLEKINAVIKPSFEEAKATIESEYRRQQSEKQFFEQADQIANLSFENPDTLDIAAEEVGLSVKTSPLFTRLNGQDIAQHANVRNSAFSEAVLVERQNSEIIQIGENHIAVIRIVQHQPARSKTFDEAKNLVKDHLTREKTDKQITDAAAQALEQAKTGEWDNALATRFLGELQLEKDITRNDTKIAREIINASFVIPADRINRFSKVAMNNGSYAIVKLLKVTDGDIASLTSDEKQRFSNELLTAQGRSDFNSTLALFKSQSKVIIHPDLEASAAE